MAGSSEYSGRRDKYVRTSQQGWFYLAPRRDAESPATWIRWGTRPEVDLGSIRRLDLAPSAPHLKDATLPELVTELPALEVLSLPLAMVPALGSRPLPGNTRLLVITHDEARLRPLEARKLRWPDVTLPQVRGLFFGSEGTEDLWPGLGIPAAALPGLEYLRTDVDRAGKVLEQLDRFGGLRMAELFDVRDHDPFAHLPPTLTDLAINTTGRSFSFSGMARLEALVTLQVVGMRCELDCEVFRSLPNLREANVSGPGRIKNGRVLAALPQTRFVGFERAER